jgi:antitoxin component HigA of HigAB toxin-antitoxin module
MKNLILLTKYQPNLIENHEEYQEALSVVEYFVFKKSPTPEKLALYDLTIMLVKEYESKIYPMDDWRT